MVEIVTLALVTGIGVFLVALRALFAVSNDGDGDEKEAQIIDLIESTEEEILIQTDGDCLTDDDKILHHLLDAIDERDIEVTIRYDRRFESALEGEDYTALREAARDEPLLTLENTDAELERHYWVWDGKHVRFDEHDYMDFENSNRPGVIAKGFRPKAEWVRNAIKNKQIVP